MKLFKLQTWIEKRIAKMLDEEFWNLIHEGEKENNMTFYKKKALIIKAIEWTGENHSEIEEYCGSDTKWVGPNKEVLYIKTLEGEHLATKGDFIIQGIHGEHYPCKPDIFAKLYDPVFPFDVSEQFLEEDYNKYTKPLREK